MLRYGMVTRQPSREKESKNNKGKKRKGVRINHPAKVEKHFGARLTVKQATDARCRQRQRPRSSTAIWSVSTTTTKNDNERKSWQNLFLNTSPGKPRSSVARCDSRPIVRGGKRVHQQGQLVVVAEFSVGGAQGEPRCVW